MENLEKEAYIYREFLKRLSTQEFWEVFKKFYNVKNLNEFGIDIYEKLEAYHIRLSTKVEKAMRKALDTHSSTELNLIRAELETTCDTTGRLRFLLRGEEQKINGMLKGINGILKSLGEKTEHAFYRPKPEKMVKDVVCPYCEEINTDFEYNNMCKYCHELIQSPWKEHTICPNIECSSIINSRDIISDPSAYELDSQTREITCPYCVTRFDWRKYRRRPEKMGLKVCLYCDMPFIPNKNNWHTQRICSNCKGKGVDSFMLDHPEYQKQYRNNKKR